MKPQRSASFCSWLAGILLALAGMLQPWAGFAAGTEIPDITFEGANTLRLENYQFSGDPAGSPYNHQGSQWYDELQLSLRQELSAYNTMQLDAFGVYNKSDYRAQNRTLLLERLNFRWENGDADLPFRLDAGDIYAELSQRTMSRTLKGLQLDLQPVEEFLGGRQSFLLFAGADGQAWRHLNLDEGYFAGASWLLDSTPAGSFSLNWAHNVRDAGAGAGARWRQHVGSLAYNNTWKVAGSEELTLDAELAGFRGDTAGGWENDHGRFLQLAGRGDHPLSYRLRFEEYGENFLPQGGSAAADRRSYEAHAAWTFANRVSLRGRAQLFENAFQSNNQTDTKTYGLSLDGPFLDWLDPELRPRLDAFVSFSEDENWTAKNRTDSWRFNVGRQLTEKWSGDFGAACQRAQNGISPSTREWTNDLSARFTRQLQVGAWNGSIGPGVIYRWTQGDTNDSHNLAPSFSADLARDAHSFSVTASYGGNRQYDPGTIDTKDYTLAASYNYSTGPHSFGIEGEYGTHNPIPGTGTRYYKLAGNYTFRFGGSISATERKISFTPAGRRDDRHFRAPAKPVPDVNLLWQIATDMPLEAARALLKDRYGLAKFTEKPQFDSYDIQLLPDFEQRQQFIVEHQAGKVVRTALLIDLEDVGRLDTVEQIFLRARSRLTETFGRPVTFHEDGAFTPALLLDLAQGRFSRIYEWVSPNGILRFGIPRRLDRQLRLEIQHAPRFPVLQQSLWSVEAAR